MRTLSDDPPWCPDGQYQRLAQRLRQIGVSRILFGSDWPEWEPGPYREDLAKALPLTKAELEQILSNRAPWM